MPVTIPQMDDSGVAPEIAQGGGLNVQTTPQDMGAGASPGLEQAGKALQDIQSHYDDVQVQSASTKQGELGMQKLQGVLTSQGINAAPAAIKAQQEIRASRDQIAASLANNDQREAFGKMADSQEMEFLHWSGRHVAEQADQVDRVSTVSALHLATQQGAFGALDPVNVAMKYHTLNDTIDRAAARQGWTKDETDANRLQATDGYWGAVMNSQLVQKQPAAAAAILAKYGDEMTQETRDHYTKATQISNIDVQAQSTSDRLTAPDPKTGAVAELKDILPQVRAIQDPELRQATLRQVQQTLEENERAANQHTSDQFTLAQQQLTKGGWDMNAITAPVKASLTPAHLRALQTDAEYFTEQKDQDTNDLSWLHFHDQAVRHPADLAAMNPDVFYGTYRDKMSKGVFDKAMNVYDEIRAQAAAGKAPGDGPMVKSMLSDEQRIDASLTGTPLMPVNVLKGDKYENPGMTPAQQGQHAQFMLNIDQQFADAARAKKVKELEPEDKQKIIDAAIRNTVFVKGTGATHWLGKNDPDQQVPVSALSNSEQGNTYLGENQIPSFESISPQQLLRIRSLAPAGKNLSNDQIRRIAGAAAIGADGMVQSIMKE